ncbi:MAG TPA: ABC transporter permease [Thermoleophilaceae bacterium]|nr:ABC transporter permease [Thermoleophilaceae bacterium]
MSSAAKTERTTFVVVGSLALVFLLAPMLIVVLASLDSGQFFTFPPTEISSHWFSEIVDDETWRASFGLTLTIAALTAVASSIIGGLAGIAVARVSPRVRRLMYPLLIAPLIVPVIVLAISFYTLALELHLVGTLFAFVMANTILTAPLVALLVMGTCLRLDHRLELASLSCGASPTRTLIRITFPLVGPTAVAGGALAFLLVLDEVVMSLFLVAPGKTPLAVKLFLQAQTGTAPIVMAASSILIFTSLVVLAAVTALRSVLARRTDEDLAPDVTAAV